MNLVYLKAAAIAAVGALTVTSAQISAKADVEFQERGSVGYLISHRLRPGDEEAVQEFLDRPRATPLRVVYMDSRGGQPRVGMAIGQMIRERGLDTGFHVGGGRKCVSACTAMFLGGVHRYYLGGGGVRDGVETKVGLGFHTPKHPTAEGEDTMNEYYRSMGAPGTTALRYHNYARENLDEPFEGVGPRGRRPMYFTGARTAIRAGVATSTSAPRGLRDY